MVKETGWGLIRYSKKTGKVDTAMTGMADALMNLWALQNTTKTKESIIFDLETGAIKSHYVGTTDGFPNVEKNISCEEKIDEHIRISLEEDFKKGR